MVATTIWAKAVDRVSVVDVVVGRRLRRWSRRSPRRGRQARPRADARRWLMLALVGRLGAGRLVVPHRAAARVGHGEDPRYAAMLGGTPSQVGIGPAIRRVFVVQGIAIWFVVAAGDRRSAPCSRCAGGPVVWVGVARVGVGAGLRGRGRRPAGGVQGPSEGPEATGHADRAVALHPPPQLLRRRLRRRGASGSSAASRPAGPGPGDASLAPVAMTYFLVFATGARLLERTMMERPGYPEYAARTSMFLPLPPRSGLVDSVSWTASRTRSRRRHARGSSRGLPLAGLTRRTDPDRSRADQLAAAHRGRDAPPPRGPARRPGARRRQRLRVDHCAAGPPDRARPAGCSASSWSRTWSSSVRPTWPHGRPVGEHPRCGPGGARPPGPRAVRPDPRLRHGP